ncbi:hypothetical protein AJ80_07101 [Polytolypa hystricis UAMH7299]|uniref:VWFA domain-containing protein n=1 Tax=Polytolypa hystricis (strain UAMH7299) TaxID=1447883 RepID=A0A2B7XRN6_POLH7|nr:hypothetical protein AJ80_07101 [Polytolypa hystricis UAMH7299]
MPTDMSGNLTNLFKKYRNGSKAATLLVLTDGAWEGTVHLKEVERKIIEEATDQRHLRFDRHLTIQFIRFGIENKQKLTDLDSLGEMKETCDIVDQTCWKSNVNKMILGSITPSHDNQNDEDELDSPPCTRWFRVVVRPGKSLQTVRRL